MFEILATGPLWKSLKPILFLNFFNRGKICACAPLCVCLSVSLWIVAHQDPLSMGILQARTPEWVVMSVSRDSSGVEPLSLISPALAGRFFTSSVIWEAHGKMYIIQNLL